MNGVDQDTRRCFVGDVPAGMLAATQISVSISALALIPTFPAHTVTFILALIGVVFSLQYQALQRSTDARAQTRLRDLERAARNSGTLPSYTDRDKIMKQVYDPVRASASTRWRRSIGTAAAAALSLLILGALDARFERLRTREATDNLGRQLADIADRLGVITESLPNDPHSNDDPSSAAIPSTTKRPDELPVSQPEPASDPSGD